MTITENTSALVSLYKDTRDYFGKVSPATSVVFGRRERTMQINQGTNGANRVVFVPGRLADGAAGVLEGVDGPGETIDDTDPMNPIPHARALFLQGKLATLSVWAADPTTDPTEQRDEAAAEQIIEQLFEYTIRAVKRSLAGHANVAWSEPRYTIDPKELRYGDELLCEFVIGTQFFDDVPNVLHATGVTVSRGSIG